MRPAQEETNELVLGPRMKTSLVRPGLVAALMAMPATAAVGQATDDPLRSAMEAVAALPGAPAVVSAAGLTRSGERLLTLEDTVSIAGPRKRLVLVGGLDGTVESASAVLEALQWLKTEAPAPIESAWSVAALPCARPPRCLGGVGAAGASSQAAGASPEEELVFPPEGGFFNHETTPESRYVWRWVAYQAPDLVLEVRAGEELSWEVSEVAGALGVGGSPPPDGTLARAIASVAPSGLARASGVRASTPTAEAPRMLALLLDGASSLPRSPLHFSLLARLRRTPIELATRLANRYPSAPSVSYIAAVAWSNRLRLADRLGDAERVEAVRGQMAPYLSGETPAMSEPYRLTSLAGLFAFVDFSGPGQSPEALDLAIAGSELMFPESPGTSRPSRVTESPDAILRSPTGWTDDMFMASSLLSRLGARTGDARYGDTVERLLQSYTQTLQRPDGLFVHSARGPHAWGRGNGFALLGLTEALTYLPASWSGRPRALDIYRNHVDALVRHQAPDGMWRQVVDEPGSYRELTVTSMTLVALARGVRRGWLDDSYRSVIGRAWRGITTHVANDGTIVDASTSTGAGETKQYYLDRTAIAGPDDRGGAMALWAAMEMDELQR